MPATYEPIATTTLGSAAATVTFTSISGSYTDIVAVFNGTNATSSNGLRIRINGDTGSNYSATILYGTGSSASSSFGTNETSAALGGDVGSTQATVIIHLQNYSNTTTYKTMLGRGSSAGTWADANVALWRSTAAITSIQFRLGAGTSNFGAGSTFTLYGIKAA